VTVSVLPSSAELLTVTVRVDDAVVRVSAAGEIDACSVPLLVSALAAATGMGRAVVVDLTAVTFLDSSGLQGLGVAYRRSVAAGKDFRVIATSRVVLRPLQLSGLWALMDGDRAPSGRRHAA
jgi:anti-sigma B factor antagonist